MGLNQAHVNSCGCATCERLKSKVQTTEYWLSEHQSHGALHTEPLSGAPAGYPFHWLVCVCGSRHATDTQLTDGRTPPS